MNYTPGVMMEDGICRQLDIAEYNYWMLHHLPFGWVILAPPKVTPSEQT